MEFLEKNAAVRKVAVKSPHNDVLLDSEECHEWKAACAHADVDSLVGSLESTRSGKVAAEVPSGVGRYRWQKWRSSANGVGNSDGDGKIWWERKGRSSKSGQLWSWTWQRPSSGSVVRWFRAWATHISFPEEDLTNTVFLCFEHRRRVQFEGCVAEPLQTITANRTRVEVELFASAYCIARCAE